IGFFTGTVQGALDDATLDAQVGASRETMLQVIAGGITSKVPGLGNAVNKVLVDAAFDDFQDTQDANDQLKDEFEQLALATLPGNSGNGLDVNHPNRSEFNNARQNGQG